MTVLKTLFARMVREELRLHAELFGRRRFLFFPVFVALLVGAGVELLDLVGTSRSAVIGGLFVLVLFFGFQVGTIGLVGRDAMRDVLGDVTLLVFSARTLPVSRRLLLGVFLLKDLLYYAVFFLTPVAAGFLPLVVSGRLTPSELLLLWATLVATFGLGTTSSLALAGIATRSSVAGLAVVSGIALGVIGAPDSAIGLTPYGLYASPSPRTALTSLGVLGCLFVAAPVLFEPSTETGVRRIDGNQYRAVTAYLDGFATRPLLEVHRSSGSVWKVLFSLGILFAVTALLLNQLVAVTGLDPSPGIAFGTLLGLGSFTTYNWITQVDSPREYLRYPVSMSAVFTGKGRAFLVLSVPAGIGYLGLAGLWYPFRDLLIGTVVFPLVSVYVFGLTAYLAGLSPNELLFDTVLFGIYGVSLAVVAVPLLVGALAAGTAPVQTAVFSLALSGAACAVGVVLSRRAGDRWQKKFRTS